MSTEAEQLLTRGHVPPFQRLLIAAGEGETAVVLKRHRFDSAGMPAEAAQLFACGQLPQFQRPLAAVKSSTSCSPQLPERANFPLGENATEMTRLVCPLML